MLSRFFASLSALERRLLLTIVVLQALAISLPYLWALAVTPEGLVYGGLLYNPDDQNVHLAWARQAAEGKFFFADLFTTESLITAERPLFFNLLPWLMGALSALTKIPLIWMYHLLRVLFSALTLLLFCALCTRLTTDVRTRLLALALVAFSGGGGFLAELLPGRNWMDRADNPGFPMMPEAFTFASAFVFTLNIASMALLLAVYLLSLHAWETGSRRAAVGAGASSLLLANIHTYDVFPLLPALTIWALLHAKSRPRRNLLFLPLVYLGAAIPVAYQYLVFRTSEEFRVKALTQTPAPPLLDVLLSFGPLLALAVAGGILAWRQPKMRLMVFWTLSTLVLIYAPVSFARKMIEGVHLPLCLLAAVALVALLTKLPSRVLQRGVALGVLGLLSVSSFRFVAWCLENAQDNNQSQKRIEILMPPLYLNASDAAALQFLSEQPRGKVVLSLPFIGNYLPRETGQTAYAGHWAETLHFQKKLGPVWDFYSGSMSPEKANSWLRQNRIDYIFVGSYEQQLGELGSGIGQRIFEQGGTEIYAVPPAAQAATPTKP